MKPKNICKIAKKPGTYFHPDIIKWILLFLFVLIRVIRRLLHNLGLFLFVFIRVIRGLSKIIQDKIKDLAQEGEVGFNPSIFEYLI